MHYDWTAREYSPERPPVPESILQLCERANGLFGALTQPRSYTPEAVIVNYYGERDSMTGHLDDAELDQSSPIYSLSLGLACVFVIGGSSKEQPPLAVALRSGDLAIMSGPARQSWHGVPRVMSGTFASPPHPACPEAALYLAENRININARQVHCL
jgi:alkylated DNA repair protein alkB family protein 1